MPFPCPVKAVFLDVGGTLIAPSPSLGEVYRRVLAPFGIRVDAAVFRRAHALTWAEFDRLVGPGRDRYAFFPGGEAEFWSRYIQRVLERSGDGVAPTEAIDALHAAFRDPSTWAIYPEVPGVLTALKERGLKLGVLSNWDSRLRGLLAALGLAPLFDSITVSSEVGAEKPAGAIFEAALGSLGIAAVEAVHVGDDPVGDWEGARAAGLGAFLLTRRGTCPPGASCVATLEGIVGPIAGRTISSPGEITA